MAIKGMRIVRETENEIVIEAGAISYRYVQETKAQLEMSSCPILGTILNKVDYTKDGYGKYGKYHLYSHRKGQEMPPYAELAQHLEIGDLLAAKKGSRHIMMFIGTLRQFGFTAETAPELADYLDYTLVIHSGPNPDYGARMQQFLDAPGRAAHLGVQQFQFGLDGGGGVGGGVRVSHG